jgi:hypothetical protein
MKNLLLTLSLITIYAIAHGQNSCDCDFKTTFAAHYNYFKSMNGIGLEYGKTGDESPFSIHIGLDMFFPSQVSKKKTESAADTVLTGRMYNKVGYRLLRIPYQLSIYADALGGLDMSQGFFYGVGLKILRPFNENAISIEPIYISGKKGGWNFQAAFHIRIQ